MASSTRGMGLKRKRGDGAVSAENDYHLLQAINDRHTFQRLLDEKTAVMSQLEAEIGALTRVISEKSDIIRKLTGKQRKNQAERVHGDQSSNQAKALTAECEASQSSNQGAAPAAEREGSQSTDQSTDFTLIRLVPPRPSSSTLRFLDSSRGGRVAVLNDFMYTVHKKSPGKISWRCIVRKCRGGIQTSPGEDAVLLELPHDHDPDVEKLMAREATQEIKKLAVEAAFDSPNKIIQMVKDNFATDVGKKKNAWQKAIQRTRKANYAPLSEAAGPEDGDEDS
ncbi:hypothetical protein BV898_14773 [Hypsibius exemplaris]|uniref:FLYWCH-type domain-containing protein n=1 Tax=Hypsibius exemplaris TaxID=2072580 RepID=A0A9X6N9A2_HYPEX|nr:hypothetical protein BV898_14773 [Hypsibius exemplaris]